MGDRSVGVIPSRLQLSRVSVPRQLWGSGTWRKVETNKEISVQLTFERHDASSYVRFLLRPFVAMASKVVAMASKLIASLRISVNISELSMKNTIYFSELDIEYRVEYLSITLFFFGGPCETSGGSCWDAFPFATPPALGI